MITERELRRIAGRIKLGIGQAEQEYVILCVLDALAGTLPLAETFCLKGGTALRQLYFADWRYSVDLDFSVLPAFVAERLQSSLLMWFEQVERLHGVQIALADLHRANGAARVRARFVGPLRHPSPLFLDVTLDEPVLLSPQRRPVLAGMFENPRPIVLCYALEEILAEKLRSILQRGKARDYYDVWRLLREKAGAFDREVTRGILSEKCRHKGLPEPTAGAFLSPIVLDAAAAYWSQDLIGHVPDKELPAWQTVMTELRQLLADFLFPR